MSAVCIICATPMKTAVQRHVLSLSTALMTLHWLAPCGSKNSIGASTAAASTGASTGVSIGVSNGAASRGVSIGVSNDAASTGE